ncbi:MULTISPECIES: hypothetical protein [unclassified Janthinobacterium]|nr:MULTISPECIES: hypothetical protein [unclassified Janthinobacterium]
MNQGCMPACLLWLAGLGAPALAAGVADDWTPVSEAVLDEARGGYDLGGGLVMSLGIERMASVNGTVVSSSSFSIADVSRLGQREAALVGEAAAALNLLQNGAGNTFIAGPMTQTAAGTVIQNSLNDQVLRTHTVINTSVNSLELLKMINFEDGLRNALSNAIGAR